MRRTGTYYLIIALSLFTIFTIGMVFLLYRSQESIPTSSPKPLPNTQAPLSSPLPLIAETDDYKIIEQIQEEKPWIKLVPIVSDNYITRYDYESDSIQIIVYTQNNQIKYSEEDIKNIRSAVEEVLTQRGIDLNSVKITARVE